MSTLTQQATGTDEWDVASDDVDAYLRRTRAARTEKLGAAVADFDFLPFDGEAAARYGTLVALAAAAGRDPRPRRMDLMSAAIASTRDLPLYTRNPDDFKGLDNVVTVVAV